MFYESNFKWAIVPLYECSFRNKFSAQIQHKIKRQKGEAYLLNQALKIYFKEAQYFGFDGRYLIVMKGELVMTTKKKTVNELGCSSPQLYSSLLSAACPAPNGRRTKSVKGADEESGTSGSVFLSGVGVEERECCTYIHLVARNMT